ncbi:uncharacterized protein [Aphelocoma coerulescens]|uniref:uncharacterized protein n=1 Tax=Aphelocoma coerulescens TaxID=39617 RepID=UPI00360532E6
MDAENTVTLRDSRYQFMKNNCLELAVIPKQTSVRVHCCTQGCQPAPHTLLPSRGRTGSSPGSSGPEPGAHGAPAPLGRGAGRHRGSPGSSRPSAPSRARRQRLLAGPRGRAGRGGQGWAQGAPGQGAEPAPTLPSWRSLQLAEDRSRAAECVRRALPYLYSPQESLREAAARFMVIAGQSLTRQQGAFGLICQALEHMRRDVSPAIRSLALQALFALGTEDTSPYPVVQRLQDQLRRAWERHGLVCRALVACTSGALCGGDLGGFVCWGHLSQQGFSFTLGLLFSFHFSLVCKYRMCYDTQTPRSFLLVPSVCRAQGKRGRRVLVLSTSPGSAAQKGKWP